MSTTTHDDESGSQLPEITITIKGPSEVKLALTISPSILVSELKSQIARETNPSIEVERQRLIYSGKVLKDEEPLSTYKIQNGHSIHLVKGANKSGTAAAGTAGTVAGAAASERAGVPTNLNAGMEYAGNPLAGLEGVRGHGYGGGMYNPFAAMPGGERNLNDPNAMANMMNDPEVISQAMLGLTPEMIDRVIASNPQLAAMGPQVRQMLTDPMMREMMANPDMVRRVLAMSGGRPGMGLGANPFGGAGAGGAAAANPFANLGREGEEGGAAAAGGNNQAANAAPNPAAANDLLAGLFGGAGAGNPNQAGAATAANPFAGMFGAGAGAGAANPFGIDPAMMEQARQMYGLGGPGLGNMGGMGGFGGTSPAAPADTRPAEERFQSQLAQLNEMGLVNPQQNIRALTMTGGNVQAAIELIFSGGVPS